MESTDFVKADSRNLPVVDPFMMAAYFNALHGSSLEVHTRGEDGFGPRGVKNSSVLPTIFWCVCGGGVHIHLQKNIRDVGAPASSWRALVRHMRP